MLFQKPGSLIHDILHYVLIAEIILVLLKQSENYTSNAIVRNVKKNLMYLIILR